ncbi:ABC transporter substrate-binding protein [Chachezhania sediminis]|uniref:ABC transporter substrate-binding protein n=1 Tax=Chachezhania sediminis TaxID=2599291 RepID=UPI00131B9984|nr:ABC transporter substrate-binding protein [Chachezhania sediminis]
MELMRTKLMAACAVLAISTTAAAAGTTVKIGSTNAYSGPASAYGQIGQTSAACFNWANDNKILGEDTIEFIPLDDGYSPPKTVEQTRKLVERDEVVLTFQQLGTPTNSAIHKYMNAKKVPHLFLATGASKWGDPENFPWTMGWQPPYPTEGEIYGKYLIANKPDAKVAILYQNDDYGKDYLNGFKKGLGDKADEMIVAETPYEVADPTVDSAIISFKSSGADTFFNIATPKFAAQAIRKADEIGWKPLHFLNSVSNSVGAVLKPAGLEASQDIISSGYLMDPTDPEWQDHPEFKDWLAFMDKYYPDGDKTSSFTVLGWASCQTMLDVLKRAEGDYSRDNIMEKAASIHELRVPLLLPGILIDTSPTDYYPIEAEQLMRFTGEGWERFGDIISAESE